MKWKSEWWGIVIESENADDDELLNRLNKELPENAYSKYEDGMRESGLTEDGKLNITFER